MNQELKSAHTLHFLLLTLSVGSLLDLAGIMDVDSFWVLTSCSFLHRNQILEEGSDLPSLGQTPACMGSILLQVVAVGDFPEEEQ